VLISVIGTLVLLLLLGVLYAALEAQPGGLRQFTVQVSSDGARQASVMVHDDTPIELRRADDVQQAGQVEVQGVVALRSGHVDKIGMRLRLDAPNPTPVRKHPGGHDTGAQRGVVIWVRIFFRRFTQDTVENAPDGTEGREDLHECAQFGSGAVEGGELAAGIVPSTAAQDWVVAGLQRLSR
jgi:hypothetical protein